MLSVSSVLRGLCLGLLVSSAVSPVHGDEFISFQFQDATEDFLFNGNGATSSSPLFGITNSLTTNGVTTNSANQIVPLFSFAGSTLPTGSYFCCYGGTDTASCSASHSTPLAITLANFLFSVNKVYKLSCGFGTQTPLYVEFRQFINAPIVGQLDWIVDAPASPYDLQTGTSTVAPTTFQVPFISHIKLNTGTGNTILGNAATYEPTEWVQVTPNTGVTSGALFPTASSGASLYSFAALSSATGSAPSATNINKFVACGLPIAGTNPVQYTAVTDAYPWPVPSEAQGFADYYPVCFFEAVQTTGNPATVQNSVVVWVQLHIRILAPCVAPSGFAYSWSEIFTLLQPPSGKHADPSLFDLVDESDPTTANQISSISRVVNFAQQQLTGQFPFYSLLEAADSGTILDDPIGNYWARKKWVAQYGTNPGFPWSPPATWTPAPSPDDASIATDSNHAIICRYIAPNQWTDASQTTPDDTLNYPLVNDLFKLDVTAAAAANPIGSVDFDFLCSVFDISGAIDTIPVTITVNYDNSPPQCTDPSCSGVSTDPQFSGFLGQSYQIHGVSGNVYNILSSARFQYNALFTYLNEGRCRKGTQCYSHPGNYFGSVGVSIRSDDGSVSRVEVISGPVDVGLQVLVNDAPIKVSSTPIRIGDASLTLASPFDFEIDTPEFAIRIANSDMFLNQDVAINSRLLSQIQRFKQAKKSQNSTAVAELSASLPHGLLGQTWQYQTYNNRWKYIEGTLFEYALSDGIMGSDFKYNRF